MKRTMRLKTYFILITCLFISIPVWGEKPSVDFSHGSLKISENKRFLVHEDGTPFFWLGDTAWELFHRLTVEEAERYLENRRAKGFTVIQTVALAERDGHREPNPYGELPLIDLDPARPNDKYFQHVDAIVRIAREKGIVLAIQPTWGAYVLPLWAAGSSPKLFDAENARAYGIWLGRRYRNDQNIIWMLGGDRPPQYGGEDYIPVWRALAEGLREGDGGSHLITYHPHGGFSSSYWLHDEPWLDFNCLQSGHGMSGTDNYTRIDVDYNRVPVKPCFDGEPNYETIPRSFKPADGRVTAFEVRRSAYWSLFAGGFGYTYGCNNVWQMYDKGREPVLFPDRYWHESLDLPGARQMTHVRALMESRPMLARVPDNGLIAGGQKRGVDHMEAARGEDYAFVYIPTGNHVTITMGRISGETVRAWWYNPRNGEADDMGMFANEGTETFLPPGGGQDWVLVLDDVGKRYSPPGIKPN